MWCGGNEDGADGAGVLLVDGKVMEYEFVIVAFCLCMFVCGDSSADFVF